MSRSYRHNIWFPFEYDHRGKKFANRKVRRSKHLYQGSDYKKVYDSWNFRMGKWGYADENDYVQWNLGYEETEDELRKRFRKHLRSK